MDEAIRDALARDRTIDITATGRRSGESRRIEIWFHRIEGRYFITGMPGSRNWYANLVANPRFTFHLKESAQADLPARARPVTDRAEKRRLLLAVESLSSRLNETTVEPWVEGSPMVEVIFDDEP